MLSSEVRREAWSPWKGVWAWDDNDRSSLPSCLSTPKAPRSRRVIAVPILQTVKLRPGQASNLLAHLGSHGCQAAELEAEPPRPDPSAVHFLAE